MGLDIVVDGNPDLDFRAGSYSGFHEWRCWLASILGLDYNKLTFKIDMPFSELFFHSDCDGTLGVRACKQLLKDFDYHIFIAMLSKAGDPWLFGSYRRWHEAVRAVAENHARKIVFC